MVLGWRRFSRRDAEAQSFIKPHLVTEHLTSYTIMLEDSFTFSKALQSVYKVENLPNS